MVRVTTKGQVTEYFTPSFDILNLKWFKSSMIISKVMVILPNLADYLVLEFHQAWFATTGATQSRSLGP